jgi:hypothetical protein
VRQRRPRHVEVAVDVGAEGEVEPLVGDLLERGGVLLVGGVVDEHVELAERLHRLGDRPVAEPRVLDVAGEQEAAPPFGFDSRLGLAGIAVRIEVDDGDVGALAREQHRDGAADARIAPGHDRREALELAAAAVVGGEKARRQVEVGLAARLGLVLGREARRLAPRARLHRGLLLLLRAAVCLVARVARVLRLLDAPCRLAGRGGAERGATRSVAGHRSLLLIGRLGGRPARAAPITVAITVIMCGMSTGLSTCAWKPAAKACFTSAGRPWPVSAIAGRPTVRSRVRSSAISS